MPIKIILKKNKGLINANIKNFLALKKTAKVTSPPSKITNAKVKSSNTKHVSSLIILGRDQEILYQQAY